VKKVNQELEQEGKMKNVFFKIGKLASRVF
jgi:hypothetical protein